MAGRAQAATAADRFSDLVTAIQILSALGVGWSQVAAMQSSVEGVGIAWLGLWLAFLLVNLALSMQALALHRSRIAVQTVWIYVVWSGVIGVTLSALLWLGGRWTIIDTVTTSLAACGVTAAIIVAALRGLGPGDALVRATFAVFCKGVPQLTLAWLIWRDGGDGLALWTILAGHITINLRLVQIGLSIREAGWDRSRTGLLIGEGANILSWIVATIAWVLVD